MNDFRFSDFAAPPTSAHPMARWWWTGLDVQQDELFRELEDMAQAGFAGAEIQAFTRGFSCDPDDPEAFGRLHRYGTPFYYDLVRKLMEKARQLHLLLDVTAGSGWPMGDTLVDAQSDGMRLLFVGSCAVEGSGERCSVPLPTSEKAVDDLLGGERSSFTRLNGTDVQVMDYPRMKREMSLLKVSIAKPLGEKAGCFSNEPAETTFLDPGSLQDVTEYVQDGVLQFSFPKGKWMVFAAYTGPSFQQVKSDSRQFPDRPSPVINHFGKGIAGPYLDRHIGEGKWDAYAGKPFRAAFADSFELIGPYFWSDNFLTEFQSRRGYDLTPYLPFVMVRENRAGLSEGDPSCFSLPDHGERRIRYDVEKTLGELFVQYFLQDFTQWCHSHGIKSRVQCYGHAMDNLKAFGSCDIPETEQLASAGLIDFLKLASSAAILYGKELASAETMVWPGRDYMETPLKIKGASDRLTISGIGQIIYHGMPYLHPNYAWPGFFPWKGAHGTFLARTNTIWPWMRQCNDAVARNQWMIQQGAPQMDIAVLLQDLNHEFLRDHPEELSAGVLPGIDRPEDKNATPGVKKGHPRQDQWYRLSEKARSVGLTLQEAGYDYCHINGDCLSTAVLKDGVLHAGAGRFRALIIPENEWMEPQTADHIARLIDAGFPVWFEGTVPTSVPGWLNHQRLSEEMRARFAGAKPVRLERLPEHLADKGILPGVCFHQRPGLQQTCRRFSNGTAYFVRSRIAGKRMVPLSFPGQKQDTCCLLDGWSGKIARLERVNGIFQVPFVDYGSHWFFFPDDPSKTAGEEQEWLNTMLVSVCGHSVLSLNDGWDFEGLSAVPGQDHLHLTNLSAGDWADNPLLSGFSGKGIYRKTFMLDESQLSGQLILDLGLVGDIAQITINGKPLEDLLSLPYAQRIGHLLKAGENQITIAVVNCLRNGMIGAGLLQAGRQKAMSGLVGPVTLKVPESIET